MSPDTKALVDAIDSLRQSSSLIKSYVWPLIPAVITSAIGFYIASYNFKSQEKIRADVKKIENANKFVVQIDSAFQSLISVKSSYMNRIDDDPISRVLSIAEITNQFSDINGVEELVFLARGNKSRDGQPYYVSWNNIPRINAMVGNYKYLLQRIEARNILRREFEIYAKLNETGQAVLNLGALEPIGWSLLKRLVNSNECIIALIDGLILEFNSFLCGITKAIEASIEMRKVKHIVMLVVFKNNIPFVQGTLQPTLRPDYDKLSKLLDVDITYAKEMFDTGYY